MQAICRLLPARLIVISSDSEVRKDNDGGDDRDPYLDAWYAPSDPSAI